MHDSADWRQVAQRIDEGFNRLLLAHVTGFDDNLGAIFGQFVDQSLYLAVNLAGT